MFCRKENYFAMGVHMSCCLAYLFANSNLTADILGNRMPALLDPNIDGIL